MQDCNTITIVCCIGIAIIAVIIVKVSIRIKTKVIRILILIFGFGIGMWLAYMIAQYAQSKGCPLPIKRGYTYAQQYSLPGIETQDSYLLRGLKLID